MTNKLNFSVSPALFIIFLGIGSLFFRPEVMYSNPSPCVQIISFQSAYVTSNNIVYEWMGSTSGLSMDLTVTVNGGQVFAGGVTGNTYSLSLANNLVDGDVVASEFDVSCASGGNSIFSESFIVATSQVVLDLTAPCTTNCHWVNFCDGNNDEYIPDGVENYMLKAGDLCACSKKIGGARYDCIEGLMKGYQLRRNIECSSFFNGNSCAYEQPKELIVSSGKTGGGGNAPSGILTGFRLNNSTGPGFTVYPNPLKSTLTVVLPAQSTSTGDLEIRDIYGKIVHRQSMSQNLPEINLDYLPDGVYWVSLSSNRSYLQKIIKIR